MDTPFLLFSCYEYLEDSVCLLIAHRQDAAYALLRNAAETARTAARISESDDNFRRWLNHKTGKDDVLPKPTFKFNDDDIGEKIVHQTYTAWNGVWFSTEAHPATSGFGLRPASAAMRSARACLFALFASTFSSNAFSISHRSL